jgi:hypothetical protein
MTSQEEVNYDGYMSCHVFFACSKANVVIVSILIVLTSVVVIFLLNKQLKASSKKIKQIS